MKNYLLIILAIAAQTAMAQDYQLIVTSVSHSGKCGMTNKYDYDGLGGALWNAISNQQSQQFNGKIYSSKQLCEASLHSMSGTFDGCTTKVSGYCRPLGGADASIGSANVLGVNQGSSFYSINGANEIRDWSNDYIERMLALNPDYTYFDPANVPTGDPEFDSALAEISINMPGGSFDFIEKPHDNNDQDLEDYMIVGGSRIPVSVLNKPFVSVNMREDFNKAEMANDFSLLANKDNVQRYVDASKGLFAPYLSNPQDLTSLLHMEFKTVSGFDVDAIMQKLPSERTDAEKQALIDYQAYRKKTTEIMLEEAKSYIDNMEEKKEIDRAILAIAAYPKKEEYRTDNNGFVENTNFQRKDPSSFSDLEDPMRSVASALEVCNKFEDGTGFHAELYYNEKTNTYVIACAGTDDWDDWLWNNAVNAVGDFDKRFDEIPQYNMAKTIADAINRIPSEIREKLNIEIVGHSLGGGVASIIGLTTGLKTTTYNAARVPERILKEKELLDKVNNDETGNITAYHTSTDILTSTQIFFKTPAIGTSIDIGDPSTEAERKEVRKKGVKYGATAGGLLGAIGGATLGAIGGATLAEKINGHDMSLVLRGVSAINTGKNEARLQRYLNRQTSLYREASSTEYQTQESIRIFTGS